MWNEPPLIRTDGWRVLFCAACKVRAAQRLMEDDTVKSFGGGDAVDATGDGSAVKRGRGMPANSVS